VNRTDKQTNIESLKEKLARARSLVITDFRGLTVEADTKLRNEFRAQGCEYRVVKNTLLGKALEGTPMKVLESILVGPTAIAYSYEDPAAPAKVATKIAKAEEKFVIKGGYIDGQALDKKGVEALSALPSRDEMRATFLATLLAVPQNFLRLTTAAQQSLLLVLAARERALGTGEKTE
jgi:large subunit ribosomal protein L10